MNTVIVDDTPDAWANFFPSTTKKKKRKKKEPEQPVVAVEPEATVEITLPEVTEVMPAPLLPGQRPKASPYRSQLVTLRVGPNQSEYRVPQDLLQNGLWEAYLKRIDQRCLEFPSMTENSGHVLVHYLHTGTYQTLDDDNNTGSFLSDKTALEFKRAVLVYFTAREYELKGLEELAKDQIQQLGSDLNIFEALIVIDTSFADSPDKASWLHDYLYKKAEDTFERDYNMFSDGALLNQVTNVDLNRILLKAIFKVHTAVASKLHEIQRNGNEITPQVVIDGLELVTSNESAVEFTSEETVETCVSEAVTSETISEYAERAIEIDQSLERVEETAGHPEIPPASFPEFDYPTSDVPHPTLDLGSVECMPRDEVVSLPESEHPVDNEIMDCPRRVEHLLHESKWMNCEECRTAIHQVAVQLARKNRMDEEGY